jgi:hypothetical protein
VFELVANEIAPVPPVFPEPAFTEAEAVHPAPVCVTGTLVPETATVPERLAKSSRATTIFIVPELFPEDPDVIEIQGADGTAV